ncbi:MAG: sigma-54-dependent Fis family transcriptional regulator [Gemmatimonas sp.]
MSEALALVERTEQARELFFNQGQLPDGMIAPHIRRSWARSEQWRLQSAGLTPMVAPLLRERRDASRLLLDSAQPELDALAEHAIGSGCVVIVTDASGVILEEIGSPDFLSKAQRYALLPGVEWSEGQCGTNAIGTVLVEREALAVLGGEHFLPANGSLGCAASPIFTGRGEIAGVLDVTGDAVRVDGHTLSMVRMASQQIEHRMLMSSIGGHVLRFHVNGSVLGSAREGVISIIDGQIVAANRIALGLMNERWDTVLDQSADRVLGRAWNRLGKHASSVTIGDSTVVASLQRAEREARRRSMTVVAEDMKEVDQGKLAKAARVMDAGVPVLITGETGAGKEVFAKKLHAASSRHDGPFVAVNCAALPESLIESELFGYEEGAFTGAKRRGAVGRIREADGGVLLLDEIGDMPLTLQTRLLRVLEERTVTPLGGGKAVPVDFRLVCATHRDLSERVREGAFRADLLYRVQGYEVQLPALRDSDDKRAIFARVLAELGGTERGITIGDDVMDAFEHHTWPGNMRELASVLRTMIALADNNAILTLEDLPASMPAPAPKLGELRVLSFGTSHSTHAQPLADIEQQAIERALAHSNGNVAAAAKQLGVHRSTIYRHQARKLM